MGVQSGRPRMRDNSIYYVNHNGERFTLHGDGLCYMDPTPLRAFAWNYQIVNYLGGLGGEAYGFGRGVRSVQATVRMRGFSPAEFASQMNRFLAVADADNIAGKPGRLYIGNQYLRCYLAVAGEIDNNTRFSNFAHREITILAVNPYWITEVTTVFNIKTEDTEDRTGKKFDLKYPYRYGTGLAGGHLINTHYAECPAIITVYGPASAPSIIIGGNAYSVDVTLTQSQRLVIDQTTREIYTATESGGKVNAFDKRDKTNNIFAPIPMGDSQVIYDGSFKFSITLIQQRSEPKWES